MSRIWRLFLVFSLLGFHLGCGPDTQKSKLSWGHFEELDRGIDGSAFLFGLSSKDQLHACIGSPLPKGLDPEWLKAEIYSAVNLWAMTIGRAIPLVFDNCQAKPALRVLFATAPVRGDFIGFTNFEGGERRIYLNPAYDWEDVGTTLGFGKLAEYKNAPWQARASFLFPILDQGLYPSIKLAKPGPSGKLLQPSFSTILHELGHAFGLCDLYSDGSAELGFHGNCSVENRASRLSADEIMGAGTRPGTARFRLSADDKAGLKALAKRSGFPNKGWPTSGLKSQDVLDKTLGGMAKPSAPSGDEPSVSTTFKLEGPSGAEARGGGLVKVTLTVRSPASVTHAFLWEKRGMGPFQQLDQDASQVEGRERVWRVTLELEKGGSFDYQVSSSQGGGEAPATTLSFKI